jgi:hypothetical protein
MITHALGKPIAIVEIGWDTNTSIAGSQANQVIFVQEAFRQAKSVFVD